MADKIDYIKDRRGRKRFPITHEKGVRDSNWVRLEEKLKGIEAGKQDTLVPGENIKTIGGQSILGEGNIPVGEATAVKYDAQSLTDAQKEQARTNIGAASSGEVAALADQKYEGPYASASELPEASAQTMGAIYLVGPDSNDEYERKVTRLSNGSYSWASLGNTAIALANYASKESLNGLQHEVDEKLPIENSADELEIIDSSGYIITKIDADGIHAPNINNLEAEMPGKAEKDSDAVEGNFASFDSNGNPVDSGKKETDFTTPAELASGLAGKLPIENNADELVVTDENGYIIFKIDADGIHSVQSKHSVACMVLSEAYYPTEAPTRDANGKVTHAAVMFATGVAGTIDITYINANASSVAVVYGGKNYTITINRDANGNVTSVSVN